MNRLPLLALSLALIAGPSAAKSLPLPPPVKDPMANDLPVPFNVQAVVVNKGVTLSWSWQPPEKQPVFTDFGFELERGDGKVFRVSERTASDPDLGFGRYNYRVRVVGGTKVKGRRLTHISDWSEPVAALIKSACGAPPAITLQVTPPQTAITSLTSLRLRLSGQATVTAGCTLGPVTYHIDTGTGLQHSGPIKTDREGRFDTWVQAVGPEDEPPTGDVAFTVTAGTENEAGPVTSDAFTLRLTLPDKFAPR